MNVILDTNIYRQDLALTSAKFDILLDYVLRTGAEVILPRIVHDELAGVVGRDVRAHISTMEAAYRDIGRHFPQVQMPAFAPPFDVDTEVLNYLTYVKKRIQVPDNRIVQHKDSYLGDVLQRAIHRRRPCSDKGEEIRDAVLWLVVLDSAEAADDRSIVFISQNKRQFGDAVGNLHPDLAQECLQRGVRVHYFQSLEDFAKKHAVHVAFATPDWLAAAINEDDVLDKAYDSLVRLAERSFERQRTSDEIPNGDVELVDGGLTAPDYFVYEMSDGSFRVEATYFGTAALRFGVYRIFDPEKAWRDAPMLSVEDIWAAGYRSWGERSTSGRTVSVDFNVLVEALVRDAKVVQWQVNSVEPY